MKTSRRVRRVAIAVIPALLGGTAIHAADFKSGDVTWKINGTLTTGTSIRTANQDPRLISPVNGNLVGVPGIALGGRNGDDGNLNFNKGQHVSTVTKGVVSIDASSNGFGAFIRGKAWYDHRLSDDGVPWGHVPNGFSAGAKLNDGAFDHAAKFSGVSLMEAYLYGKISFGENGTLSGRLGRQTIDWGTRSAIGGGLYASINATDLNAVFRPGVQAEETSVPMWASYGKVELGRVSVDGFVQFGRTHNEAVGCGTFYANNDNNPPGCDKLLVGGLNDRAALAAGTFIKRAETPENSDTQFGASFGYDAKEIGTRFGLHYAHVDNRAVNPSASFIKTRRAAGAPVVANDPGGLNPQYFTEYPGGVDVISGTFLSRQKGTTFSGEITYKPNAPVALNPLDLINAFLNTSPSLLRDDATATPLGGVYHGFDRLGLGHYQLGLNQAFPGIFGSAVLNIGGDVAAKQVFDLPDVTVRRYGRAPVFGLGPVAGVCTAGAPAYQCSVDGGYVSAFSWGYRLRASLRFNDVVTAGLSLTPSVGITHDVKGWSADGVFNEGRMVLNLGMRADYKQQYFLDVTWNPALAVGTYDNANDRQVVTVSAGVKF